MGSVRVAACKIPLRFADSGLLQAALGQRFDGAKVFSEVRDEFMLSKGWIIVWLNAY